MTQPTKMDNSQTSDRNASSRGGKPLLTNIGFGVHSSGVHLENVPENELKGTMANAVGSHVARPKLTSATTPASEFGVLSNIEFKEFKKEDPKQGILSFLTFRLDTTQILGIEKVCLILCYRIQHLSRPEKETPTTSPIQTFSKMNEVQDSIFSTSQKNWKDKNDNRSIKNIKKNQRYTMSVIYRSMSSHMKRPGNMTSKNSRKLVIHG